MRKQKQSASTQKLQVKKIPYRIIYVATTYSLLLSSNGQKKALYCVMYSSLSIRCQNRIEGIKGPGWVQRS